MREADVTINYAHLLFPSLILLMSFSPSILNFLSSLVSPLLSLHIFLISYFLNSFLLFVSSTILSPCLAVLLSVLPLSFYPLCFLSLSSHFSFLPCPPTELHTFAKGLAFPRFLISPFSILQMQQQFTAKPCSSFFPHCYQKFNAFKTGSD